MTAALILILLYSNVWPHAVAGTYQLVVDGAAVVRMDTRTGTVERCVIAHGVLSCEPVPSARELVAR